MFYECKLLCKYFFVHVINTFVCVISLFSGRLDEKKAPEADIRWVYTRSKRAWWILCCERLLLNRLCVRMRAASLTTSGTTFPLPPRASETKRRSAIASARERKIESGRERESENERETETRRNDDTATSRNHELMRRSVHLCYRIESLSIYTVQQSTLNN